jgi:predicted transcriptional regulator
MAAMHAPPNPTGRRRVLSTKIDVDTYDALTKLAEREDRTVSYVAARILADAVKAAS